uniref:Periviscerokinin-1 n=14 Tax=Blattidae TaxID=6974 RepID=PVK1_BLAOR|nr:RecName: Full=Periviscerokinin-1; Short=Pea-PVK-1; Short=PerAm-PVK-1 [Periplaneta americana]P85558.1 RecName: Full=Periviscerokinin-1; Short=BlaOr-PVK-1 [Blatta orientalis]P85583.1 RecName: Full=Periviscerokinin-1; Short=DerEr-PVK-1 [Deropeltis erythrocephala]P85587.1 RecName: Full=Periviscerokinin-1; Short=DerIn-PVK-1 [Deropeltis integerrima]P85593.1 RecName: Full=Periviscerokinin-1; Short=DerAt-PVK-1 [Deropeltis atra]P85632.1 RecName: Full=Periviscerokinin-1; Short=EurFl-PVK-1 [Eurycotis 
GASGLIPVMRN